MQTAFALPRRLFTRSRSVSNVMYPSPSIASAFNRRVAELVHYFLGVALFLALLVSTHLPLLRRSAGHIRVGRGLQCFRMTLGSGGSLVSMIADFRSPKSINILGLLEKLTGTGRPPGDSATKE